MSRYLILDSDIPKDIMTGRYVPGYTFPLPTIPEATSSSVSIRSRPPSPTVLGQPGSATPSVRTHTSLAKPRSGSPLSLDTTLASRGSPAPSGIDLTLSPTTSPTVEEILLWKRLAFDTPTAPAEMFKKRPSIAVRRAVFGLGVTTLVLTAGTLIAALALAIKGSSEA